MSPITLVNSNENNVKFPTLKMGFSILSIIGAVFLAGQTPENLKFQKLFIFAVKKISIMCKKNNS